MERHLRVKFEDVIYYLRGRQCPPSDLMMSIIGNGLELTIDERAATNGPLTDTDREHIFNNICDAFRSQCFELMSSRQSRQRTSRSTSKRHLVTDPSRLCVKL